VTEIYIQQFGILFQFEIQRRIAVDRLNQPVVFQDRNVGDVRDGYVSFDSRCKNYVTVMRRRTDVAVQVTLFIYCLRQSN
jgi:hypothetical protein